MDKQEYVTDFQDTGACTLDIELVVRDWTPRWWIAQWKEEYRLIQFGEEGSGEVLLKVTISTEQAKELIDKIGLTGLNDTPFASATSWKRI